MINYNEYNCRPTFYNPGESIRQKAEDGGKALKQLVPPFMRRFMGEKRERGETRIVIPNNEKNPPARYVIVWMDGEGMEGGE